MAYLTQVYVVKCPRTGCTKPATHALFGQDNEPYAHYCEKHGNEALKALQEDEDRHRKAHGDLKNA